MFYRITLLLLAGLVSGLLADTPNLSFKRGGPISHVQILLAERLRGGGSIVPTLSLGYFAVSTKSSWSSDYDSGERDYSVHFFMPKVGVRLIGPRTGDLRSYTLVEAFYLLPIVSGTDLEAEDKSEARDALDLIGLSIGLGVEYFVSDQFSISIGSEAAFNLVYHTTEYTSEWDNYISNTRTILSAVLTNVTLNYYFRQGQ